MKTLSVLATIADHTRRATDCQTYSQPAHDGPLSCLRARCILLVYVTDTSQCVMFQSFCPGRDLSDEAGGLSL
jgi:hypothetical protein